MMMKLLLQVVRLDTVIITQRPPTSTAVGCLRIRVGKVLVERLKCSEGMSQPKVMGRMEEKDTKIVKKDVEKERDQRQRRGRTE